MSPQQFGACADVVILSLLYVPATRPCHMSPQCAHHCSATCPWNMTLRICLPWLDTPWRPWKMGVHLTTCKFREVRPFNWAGHMYFPVSRRMEGAHSCRHAFFLCHSTFFLLFPLTDRIVIVRYAGIISEMCAFLHHKFSFVQNGSCTS